MTEKIVSLVGQEAKLTNREKLEQSYMELQEVVGDEWTTQRLFVHAMELVKAKTLERGEVYRPIMDAAEATAKTLSTEQELDHRVAGRLITLIDSKVIYDSSNEN